MSIGALNRFSLNGNTNQAKKKYVCGHPELKLTGIKKRAIIGKIKRGAAENHMKGLDRCWILHRFYIRLHPCETFGLSIVLHLEGLLDCNIRFLEIFCGKPSDDDECK
jgi:hypothetical protein